MAASCSWLQASSSYREVGVPHLGEKNVLEIASGQHCLPRGGGAGTGRRGRCSGFSLGSRPRPLCYLHVLQLEAKGSGQDMDRLDFKIGVEPKDSPPFTVTLVASSRQEKAAWTSDISQVSSVRVPASLWSPHA